MNKSAKSTAATPQLPISKKAYERFVSRICSLFGTLGNRHVDAGMLIRALDRYLAGAKDAGRLLEPELRLLFKFICQDVDMAMERSRKARERARSRRESAAMTTDVSSHPDGSDTDIVRLRPVSRRERRASELKKQEAASGDTKITDGRLKSNLSFHKRIPALGVGDE